MFRSLCVLVSAFFLVSVKAGVPGPPQSARVRILDDDTLEVTVEPPVDDGGSVVTHYNPPKYIFACVCKVQSTVAQCAQKIYRHPCHHTDLHIHTNIHIRSH